MAINPGEILEKVRKTKPLVHSITIVQICSSHVEDLPLWQTI